MGNKILTLFTYLFFLSKVVCAQNEEITIDSSGIIIVKNKDVNYLDIGKWSCLINNEKQKLVVDKTTNNKQQTIVFLFPFDFKTKATTKGEYNVVIKKDEKNIHNQKAYFNLNPKGKYQLLSNHSVIKTGKIRGEIIDAYSFETQINKHVIIRAKSAEKRIYFYYLIDEKIINIHTDFINYSSINSIINPILITDLNNDSLPEIAFKYKTKSHEKIILFIGSDKFICRKEQEEISHSPALNLMDNVFYKQHLLNQITRISE
jgi:hypothetical protein